MKRIATGMTVAVLFVGLFTLFQVGSVFAAAPQAEFGQCVAMMAQEGPNHHPACIGANTFGDMVLHCQTMHDPPWSR